MSYSQAITEFRQYLADTQYNKSANKKALLGPANGENRDFITYDKRLVEGTIVVFVDDVSVSFTLVDAIKGSITLGAAPDRGSKVTASYYWQFWIDPELIDFLNKGAESTGQWSTAVPDEAYLNIQPGLKKPALYFAVHDALNAQIAYMINRRHSEEFLIEQDGNDDNGYSAMIEAMTKQADLFWKKACWHRDDFYKRLGKQFAPAFGIKTPRGRQYGPKR